MDDADIAEERARLALEADVMNVRKAAATMPADGKRDTRKQRARRALESLTSGDDAPYWIDPDTNTITVC